MNIFDALTKGNGKATFETRGKDCYAYYDYDNLEFRWIEGDKRTSVKLSDHAIRSNAWIPYIPRETCSNCEEVYPGKKVSISLSNTCVKCGKSFKFEVDRQTPVETKHTKVFDGVVCSLVGGNEIKNADKDVYIRLFGLPAPIAYQAKELVGKPLMKMTLEWEE